MSIFEPDASISNGEYSGIVLLNFFILLFGFVFDIVGILLWMRKIRPNGIIGIRFEAMGNNDDVWYEVNEYVGKVFTCEGLFLLIFCFIYILLPWTFSLVARVLVFLLVFFLTTGTAIFLGINRARAFFRPTTASYDVL